MHAEGENLEGTLLATSGILLQTKNGKTTLPQANFRNSVTQS